MGQGIWCPKVESWLYLKKKKRILEFLINFICTQCFAPYAESNHKRNWTNTPFNSWTSQVAQIIKNPHTVHEMQVNPRVRKIPWRRKWQPTSVLLPGEILWTEEPGRLVHRVARSQTVSYLSQVNYIILI